MLTTIGNKIVEIRPKQIIQSKVEIKNHYLVPVDGSYGKKGKKGRKPKVVEDDKQKEQAPANTETSA